MARLLVTIALVLCIAVVFGGLISNQDEILERDVRAIKGKVAAKAAKEVVPKITLKDCDTRYKDFNTKCCNVTDSKNKKIDVTFWNPNEKICKDFKLSNVLTTLKFDQMNISNAMDKKNKTTQEYKTIAEAAIVDGEVSISALTDFVASVAPAAWSANLSAIVGDCESAVPTVKNVTFSLKNKTTIACSTVPLYKIQCIRLKMIGACPIPILPTSKTNNATLAECNVKLNVLPNCTALLPAF